MDAGVEVKVESEDEVEPYDGTHACGFCSESVRGTAAHNPVHWACVAGTKYAGPCATCGGETMEAWRRVAGGGAAGPSEIIVSHIDLRDLEGEGAGAAEVVGPTQNGPREEAVESAGGTVVGTDEVSAPRFFAGADKVADTGDNPHDLCGALLR